MAVIIGGDFDEQGLYQQKLNSNEKLEDGVFKLSLMGSLYLCSPPPNHPPCEAIGRPIYLLIKNW